MSELALSGKMDKVIRFISWQMNSYKSKIADIQKGSFQASDGIEIPFYTFTPKEKRAKYPAIVYYHGGGFMFPIQKAMMDNSALYASNCGVKVFLPDYRIVPRVDCKRVNDDCYEMLRYVFQNASQLQETRSRSSCTETARADASLQMQRFATGMRIASRCLRKCFCIRSVTTSPGVMNRWTNTNMAFGQKRQTILCGNCFSIMDARRSDV